MATRVLVVDDSAFMRRGMFVGATEAILRLLDIGLRLIGPGFYRKEQGA